MASDFDLSSMGSSPDYYGYSQEHNDFGSSRATTGASSTDDTPRTFAFRDLVESCPSYEGDFTLPLYPQDSPSDSSTIYNSNSDWSRGYPPSTTAPPSRRGPRPFNEQFQNHNTPSATPRLPCEFDVLTGCRERFLADETPQWIDHVSDHLRGKFPNECWCWYCDDFKFNAETMGLDREHNFHNRLEHIREHLVDGSRLRTRRRDYPFLKFLDKNKLIPSRVAKSELSTREGPSFPGEEEENRRAARGSRRDPGSRGEAYDLAAEDRRRKKDKKSSRR